MTSPNESKTGFKTSNEFCLHLESIKQDHSFDTYIEAIVWYSENESDLEMDQLAKHLNKKLKDCIAYEARQMNMLKDNDPLISLF